MIRFAGRASVSRALRARLVAAGLVGLAALPAPRAAAQAPTLLAAAQPGEAPRMLILSDQARRFLALYRAFPTEFMGCMIGEVRGRAIVVDRIAPADVATRYPALGPRLRDAQGKPYPFVNFYLNDQDVRFRGGFAAPVQDGDEVTVIPAIAGG